MLLDRLIPQIRALILTVAVCVALALVACSEWPPYEKEVRENLFENRETFEQLEAILEETGYGLIRGRGTSSIMVGYETDGEIEYEYIDDDKGWGELLSRAKVMDISRNEDVFFFTISDANQGDVYTFFQYIHHPDADSELKVCLPSHRKVRCGECIARLDDQWWAYYKWFPNIINDEKIDALANGEITQEEYDQASDKAIDQCWREGYAEMGYKLSE
jgi:hypothetical protein